MTSEPASRWGSELIEILRHGTWAGMLMGIPYLIAQGGDRPVRGWQTPLSQEEFERWRKGRRYIQGGPSDMAELAGKVSKTVSDLMAFMTTHDAPDAGQPLQIDVVANAKEISMLPLEQVRDADGRPLLVERSPPVVLTRRIRGDFASRASRWPAKPHMLLASSAAGAAIPLDEHKDALYAALRPWVEPLAGVADLIPDPRNTVHVLDNARLEDIRIACRDADPPFTHVHILAHGGETGDGQQEEFGLWLGSDIDRHVVSGEQLAAALRAGSGAPSVVSLASCDSGNQGSHMLSTASAAHAIHQAGVPVVIASQYPLTIPGSVIVVRSFYSALFAGEDVRDALYRTRCALYSATETTLHDWESLVAYVRLPEDYADQLMDVRLAAELASLETANAYADHLTKHGASAASYEALTARLEERVAQLERWTVDAERAGRVDALEESRGLVASAYKRMAEALFRRAGLASDRDAWRERSRRTLQKSADWYRLASNKNLASAWTGVQDLSLDVVLHGHLTEPWRWHAVLQAITARGQDGDLWAIGLLPEMTLLAKFGEAPLDGDAARHGIEALVQLGIERGDDFPLASTIRQLRRYTDWWTTENGFFQDDSDLATEASEMVARMSALAPSAEAPVQPVNTSQ